MRTLSICLALAITGLSYAQFVPIPPSASSGRYTKTSALLPNGNVFIHADEQAELYDVRTGVFVHAGQLPVRIRSGAAVIGLKDGRVIIAGGFDSEQKPRNYILIWDPERRTFRQTAGMSIPRASHAVLSMDENTLLFVGGETAYGGIMSQTWETYNILQERPVSSGALPAGAYGGIPLRHPSGKIVFIYGATTTLFDPVTFTFSVGPRVPDLSNAAVEILDDGRLLVCGGMIAAPPLGYEGSSAAAIVDPLTGARESVGAMLNGRFYHAATRLPSGKVLVTGGSDHCSGQCKPVTAPAELFDPKMRTFSAVESMTYPRLNHVPIRLRSGEILFIGGLNGTDYLPGPELYVGERIVRKRRSAGHR